MLRTVWTVGSIFLAFTGVAHAQNVKARIVELKSVPAEARKAAEDAEPGVEFRAAHEQWNENVPGKVWYKLMGKKVLRAGKETITADGDVEFTPADIRNVEIRASADGRLIDIVIDVIPEELPRAVVDALKAANSLEPQYARSARTNPNGAPFEYVVWLDQRGFIRYLISADGKNVRKLPTK
jgi:hypothetical protein